MHLFNTPRLMMPTLDNGTDSEMQNSVFWMHLPLEQTLRWQRSCRQPRPGGHSMDWCFRRCPLGSSTCFYTRYDDVTDSDVHVAADRRGSRLAHHNVYDRRRTIFNWKYRCKPDQYAFLCSTFALNRSAKKLSLVLLHTISSSWMQIWIDWFYIN